MRYFQRFYCFGFFSVTFMYFPSTAKKNWHCLSKPLFITAPKISFFVRIGTCAKTIWWFVIGMITYTESCLMYLNVSTVYIECVPHIQKAFNIDFRYSKWSSISIPSLARYSVLYLTHINMILQLAIPWAFNYKRRKRKKIQNPSTKKRL